MIKWHMVVAILLTVAFPAAQLLASSPGNALLLTDDTAPEVAIPDQASELILRQRLVRVQLDALPQAPGSEIVLDLFADRAIWLICDQIGEEVLGSRSWWGYGADDEHIHAHLAVGENTLSGTILTPDGGFQIRPFDDNWHIVREIRPVDSNALARFAPSSELQQASAAAFETETANLTNNERQMNGLHRLAWNDLLLASARGHSVDMATNNYFSHTGLDGRSHADRMSDAGYSWNYAAENIAAGQTSPTEVVNAWMNSPGHRANILNSVICDLGVGYAYDSSSTYRHYWTQNFGRQQGVETCPPINTDNQTLTVFKVGSGRVTSSPAGIDCGSTCSASFTRNETVTLTATPSFGYSFASWSGACSGMSHCQLAMTADMSVTAIFTTDGDAHQAEDYYRKVNAYFYGTFGESAAAEDLADWGAVLRDNSGSVWKPTGEGLQHYLSDWMGWGTLPLDEGTATRRVDEVLDNLFGWSWDLSARINNYYINALVIGSIRERGLVNAILNDLAIMPRADGTYGKPNGWIGGPGDGLLTSAQLTRYRERIESLNERDSN